MFVGQVISLRPLTLNDKEKFYQWATNSDATPFWYGSLYGDVIPDRERFFADWTDEYFIETEPQYKRCFAIIINQNQKEIGQINYQTEVDGKENTSIEIDIIIASDNDKGKGYGTAALLLLTNELHNLHPQFSFIIYALINNQRAIKAYHKAGLVTASILKDEKENVWMKLIKQYY